MQVRRVCNAHQRPLLQGTVRLVADTEGHNLSRSIFIDGIKCHSIPRTRELRQEPWTICTPPGDSAYCCPLANNFSRHCTSSIPAGACGMQVAPAPECQERRIGEKHYAQEQQRYRAQRIVGLAGPRESKADDPLGSIALLFLGVVFLPYPALLALWSWRDLHPTRASGDGRCTMTAKVVGKRAAVRTVARRGTNRPGLLPQFSRSWYGVALDPIDEDATRQIMTFSISYETYRSLEEVTLVSITYSPHLHYVYKLERA